MLIFDWTQLGSSYLLPRLVGYNAAMELMLTAKFIDAEKALQVSATWQILLFCWILWMFFWNSCQLSCVINHCSWMLNQLCIILFCWIVSCLYEQLGLCSAIYANVNDLEAACESLAKTMVKTSSRALRVSVEHKPRHRIVAWCVFYSFFTWVIAFLTDFIIFGWFAVFAVYLLSPTFLFPPCFHPFS